MDTLEEAPASEEKQSYTSKRLGKFELPKRLVKDEESATDSFARFTAEPFETGYGHTIGNSLRRVLLSSIEGAADRKSVV